QSYNEGTTAGYRRAVESFRSAVALDPGYAAAYAALVVAEYWLEDDTTPGFGGGYERAIEAADKAIELAPEEAFGYSARGFLRTTYQFDFTGAKSDLDKAVALSPGDADVLHRSAVLSAALGSLPAAIATERRALALDPLAEEIWRRLAYFLVASQHRAEARAL